MAAQYRKPDNNRKNEIINEKRKRERELITLNGVPQVWGLSPTHVEE